MNMTRLFRILSIPTLALLGLALTADSARSQDDQSGGSFWSGGFGGGGRGGNRRQMQMQQMGGEDDGSGGYGGGFGGGRGGFGGGRGGRGGFGGGRGGRNSMYPGGGGYPGMDGGFDGGMDAGGGQPARGQGGASEAGGAKPSVADGIPHFSEVVGLAAPPGFGGTMAVSTTVTTIGSSGASSSGAATSSAASTSSGSSSPAQVDEKTRSYAQSMMKRYDKNSNGQLEKEEWAAMNDGEKYDLNKDGTITLDEMIQFLSRPLDSSDPPDASKSAAKSPSKTTYTGGRPGRFRSLAERYPDLPAKFFQMDRDGDGQIEMSEFSTTWSEETVRQFQKYDLNGDGVITPEEWLKVEPKGR